MLEFEGKTYTTISDVRKKFPVSEKTLKRLIRDGRLPEPEVIQHGTRTFRHYSDEWQEQLSKVVAPRRVIDGGGSE